MIDEQNVSYQSIANSLAASAPPGWQRVILTSKVENDVSENLFDYVQQDGSETWFDPDSAVVAKVGRALRDIRKSMTMPGEQPWSRCTFTLFPDGKFKFDVEYDD